MYSRLLRLIVVSATLGLAIFLPAGVFAYSSHSPVFTVTAPAGWQTEPVNSRTIRFYPPEDDIRFIVETTQDNTGSLASFGESSFAVLTSGHADYQFVYQSETVLAAQPALEMCLDILDDGIPAQQIIALVCVKDGWGYRLSALGTSSIMENYLSDFRDFLDSFSFSAKTTFPFRDDFNGALADVEWYRVRGDDTAFTLNNNEGFLTVSTDYGDLWGGYNNARNLLLRPSPVGDFEISTCVNFNPVVDGQQAGLLIYDNDDAYLMLSRSRSGEGVASFTLENGIESNTSLAPFTLPVTYLKITRRGNDYSGFTSIDGKFWNRVFNYPDISFSNPQIGLGAFQPVESPPVNADFDYFSLSEIINQLPEASFFIEPLFPQPGDIISFASTSLDPDGDTVSHAWYLDGAYLENVGDYPLWTWNDTPAGKHTVRLVVDDGKGGTGEYSMDIDLKKPGGNFITWVSIIAAIIILASIGLIFLKRRRKK